MSITGGLLSLLLLCIKPIVRQYLPKSTQYCMWLVVLFSFLLPLSKIILLPETAAEVSLTPVNFIVENTVVPAIVDPIVNKFTNTLASPTKEQVFFKWVSTVFLYVYPFVALLILLCGITSYFFFISKIHRCPKIAMPDELVTLEKLKGKQHPRIYRSVFVTTPMLTGIVKPTIVLPDHEYTNKDLCSILLHELTHLRQYDVVIKWLSLIVCSLHWINPAAWIMCHEIDRISELSCDEKVIYNMDNEEKQSYGDMLIAIAANNIKLPSAVLSTTLYEDKIVLKERLAAIMLSKKHTNVDIAISAAVIFAMVGIACFLGAASVELSIEPPKTQTVPVLSSASIFKPIDMYPIVYITGNKFYNGEHAVKHPDIWNADAIVSAEFAVFGNFVELMDFWGYTEEELLDVFMYCAPVGSYYWKSANISQLDTFYTAIEYFDEAHNLIGREFLSMAGTRPDSQDVENMEILFFKTYEDYEAWLIGEEK